MDRLEAITFAGAHQADKAGQKVILAALKDKYYGLRIRAIRALNMSNDDVHNAALPILTSLAQTDENTLVRAAAIAKLGALKASGNLALFRQSLSSQSYAVQAAALNAIGLLEPAESLKIAKGFENDNRGALSQAILNTYALNGTDDQWDYVYKKFMDAPAQNKFPLVRSFAAFTGRVTKPENAQAGITALKDLGIKYKQFGVGPFMTGLLTTIKGQRTKMNDEASAKAADEAVKAINDAK